jgi:hypothetical protein
MTIQQDASAFLTLLDSDNASPPLAVYDGFVPTGVRPPYVVAYFSAEHPDASIDSQSSDLANGSYREDTYAYCHCVGSNAIAARAVASRVQAALLDVLPVISGRSCWPIRHTENQPATRDESTGVLVMDQVDVYRLSSVPAP